jgi:endonuclease/exonuclease/phosphatase (EEP) superfamily protein YafD
MKKKLWIVSVAVLVIVLSGAVVVFDVPETPQIVSVLPPSSTINRSKQSCYQSPETQPLDVRGKLNILVWNIYKENRSNWRDALIRFSEQKQLLLLQESSLGRPLQAWVFGQHWMALQVNAFSVLGKTTGVMTLSKTQPLSACAYTVTEPWLRLPKSALVAYYRLTNHQRLAVVNLHAVNFSLGLQSFQRQLQQLAYQLKSHRGPVIFAGDFNSWSKARKTLVARLMKSLRLQEVNYSHDHRKRFFSLPLDHVYFRGLLPSQALVPETTASDHNPILVSFELLKNNNPNQN